MGKFITDLDQTESFVAGDIAWVRKSQEGVDKSITYSNFLKSIGNTGVKGFNAVSGGNNQFILTAANGVTVDRYYDGMLVSFIAPAGTNGLVEIKIGNLGYKNLYQYRTEDTVTVAQNQYIEAVYSEVNAAFYHTNDTNDDTSSVEYTVAGNVNAIILNTINGIPKAAYYDGMVVTFVSAGNSTQNATVAVDTLPAKPLVDQFGNGVQLRTNQAVMAVYKQNSFYTYVAAAAVYTNEYNATGVVAPDQQSTTLTLTSAFGVQKSQYYNGMSLMFKSPVNSKGVVYVNVDGLGNKVLKDPDDDDIPNDLKQGQQFLAVYDGTNFIKNKFFIEDYPNDYLPDTRPALEPVPDPFDPNYNGDPRDIANALNANSVDDQSAPLFTHKYTVGQGGNFATMDQAYQQILKDFGERGGGKKVAITILNSRSENAVRTGSLLGVGYTSVPLDLSWICLFSENNAAINVNTRANEFPDYVIYYPGISPVINFPVIKNSTVNIGNDAVFGNIGATIESTLIFGRNASIVKTSVSSDSRYNNYRLIYNNPTVTLNIIAKYGLSITTNSPFNIDMHASKKRGQVLINKLSLTYTKTSDFAMKLENCEFNIYNSTISMPNKLRLDNYGAVYVENSKGMFRNCIANDRANNMIGIRTNFSDVVLKACNFYSQYVDQGYDIMAQGTNEQNTIILDNTTGSTNVQIDAPATKKGRIISTQQS